MDIKLNQTNLIIGGVAVLGLWLLLRGFGGVAKDATRAVINVGSGAVAGVTVGLGEVVGLPDTNLSQCEIDIKNGDYWAASVSCPAARFIEYTVTRK